jgi:hypothetical protein
MQNQEPNIDFKQTTPVEGFNGEKLFGQAVIIRKIVGLHDELCEKIAQYFSLLL